MKKCSLFLLVVNIFILFIGCVEVDNKAKARKIIDKYVRATGLDKVELDTITFMEVTKTTSISDTLGTDISEFNIIVSPLEHKLYFEFSNGAQIYFDGHRAWYVNGDFVKDYSNEEIKHYENYFVRFKGYRFDSILYDAEYLETTTYENNQVHKIKLKYIPGDIEIYNYFEDKTGLLVYSEHIENKDTVKMKYIGYKNVGSGILLPIHVFEHQSEVFGNSSTITETVKLVLNYPIENVDFSREAVQYKFNARNEFDKGIDIYGKDQPKALVHFNNAIKANPNFIMAHELKINTLYSMNRYSDVIKACNILQAIQPENSDASYYKAEAYARMDEIEQARIENERYLAKLEQERKEREEAERRILEEKEEREKQERLKVLRELAELQERKEKEALELKTALEEAERIERENSGKEQKKAKKKKFWDKFWTGVENASVIMQSINQTITSMQQSNSNSSHEGYNHSSSKIQKNSPKTKVCSFCNGTGKNPAKERPPFYETGDISSTKCSICNDWSVHYHDDCPACGGKGVVNTVF